MRDENRGSKGVGEDIRTVNSYVKSVYRTLPLPPSRSFSLSLSHSLPLSHFLTSVRRCGPVCIVRWWRDRCEPRYTPKRPDRAPMDTGC